MVLLPLRLLRPSSSFRRFLCSAPALLWPAERGRLLPPAVPLLACALMVGSLATATPPRLACDDGARRVRGLLLLLLARLSCLDPAAALLLLVLNAGCLCARAPMDGRWAPACVAEPCLVCICWVRWAS